MRLHAQALIETPCGTQVHFEHGATNSCALWNMAFQRFRVASTKEGSRAHVNYDLEVYPFHFACSALLSASGAEEGGDGGETVVRQGGLEVGSWMVGLTSNKQYEGYAVWRI
jgi:hypothetical protein